VGSSLAQDTCQPKNIVSCFTHSLGMCLGIQLGMLLSPGQGKLLDSWSLSHLGYLYPGTTPIMINLAQVPR